MTNPCQGHAAESARDEHMKEAERLIAAHESAIRQHDRGAEWDEGPAKTLVALLAHIQRGAVPDGWQLVRSPISADMHVAAAKVLVHADGLHGTPQRMLNAMLAAAPAPDHFRDAAKMVPVHCTPTEHEGRIVYEHTSEPIPNADGFVLYAASADQFRTAAKMMAVQPACMTCSGHGMVGGLLPNGGGYQSDPCPDCTAPAPAEVPMPEPDVVGYVERWGGACRDCADESGVCPSTGMPCGGARKAIEYVIRALQYGVTHGYISNPISGDAREAAGYARGLAEAGRDAERYRWLRSSEHGVWRADCPRAEELDALIDAALRGEVKGLASTETECDLPPRGWRCTRGKGHEGPCAAVECPWEIEIVERAMKRLRGEAKP